MFANLNETALRAVVGTFGTVICAGVCLLGATAPANAAEAPRAKIVSYSDLNLGSAQGRTALDMRIKNAAQAVCATGLNDVQGRTTEARCIRDAVNGAQAKRVASASAYRG
jgi:UrcA family protein